MKIAALYDVHGNLPALEAVLAEVRAVGCDIVLVGGDVLPGPMPAECLRRLRELDVPTHFVRGNGDVDVLHFRAGNPPSRVPEAFHEGMRWCAHRLDDDVVGWMEGWPLTWSVELDGPGEVLFCHATPRAENEIFTERTPDPRLASVFESVGADIVVCGHTHMPFDRKVGGLRVVNPGSVGMPFGQPGAFWATIGPDGITLRRTEYDVEAASRAILSTGFPDAALMRLADPPEASAMLDAFEGVALGGHARFGDDPSTQPPSSEG